MSLSSDPLPYTDEERRTWQYEMLLLEQVVTAIRQHGSQVALAKLAAAPSLSLVPPRRSTEDQVSTRREAGERTLREAPARLDLSSRSVAQMSERR